MLKAIKTIASALALAGFLLALHGCGTVPKGAVKSVQTDGAQVRISGAGIVKADAQNTVFRIKCGVCGFNSEEMTVPTPKPGAPYILDWVCPKCGHRQKITMEALPG